MLWIILIVLLVLMIAGLPTWPYASRWSGSYGYAPSGIIFVILIVLLILLLMGYRP